MAGYILVLCSRLPIIFICWLRSYRAYAWDRFPFCACLFGYPLALMVTVQWRAWWIRNQVLGRCSVQLSSTHISLCCADEHSGGGSRKVKEKEFVHHSRHALGRAEGPDHSSRLDLCPDPC